MTIKARYVHTNLVAKNWRALAHFYVEVFDCVPVPPERDYRGSQFDLLTGIESAHLTGMHLRLPGFDEGGPTLELFQYEPVLGKPSTAVNRQGFGHIAFEVASVTEARDAVMEAGGAVIGDIVTLTTATGTKVTLIYMTDPEGNIIELQRWDK